ncbi:MAG: hypothetical protein ACM3ZA_01025 [Bacillota bacterium]
MGAITAGIYGVLSEDATLRGMLGTYQGAPAIFTVEPVPGDAPLPMIVTPGQVSDVPDDTYDSLGRDLLRDIRCYTEATGSTAQVEAIAERVRALFHRQQVPVAGYGGVLAEASGPILAPTDTTVYGLVVTVRLRLRQI